MKDLNCNGMRINGFEQIKAFYSWTFENQDKDVKPQHISLYLFLLNQNNRSNWVEWFKCPYDLAMTGACIGSKKTYYNCLNDLMNWELIQYEKGSNNWKSPRIKLEVLKRTSSVPLSEPVPEQLQEPLHTQLGTHKYKLITDNLELVTANIERWIQSSNKKDSSSIYRSFKSQPNKKGETKEFSITLEEVDKIKEKNPHKDIDSVLDSIENYNLNHKYNSLYLTALKWIKNEPINKTDQQRKTMKKL
jgi:hypothetical protein